EFAKGHGTGNDFVIIPDPDGEREISPRLVAALCDRRYGVGGDGLLRVVRVAAAGLPPQGAAEGCMDHRHADGPVGEAGGRGEREISPRLVAALCDRRYGVGGDGLLRVVRVAAAGLPPQGDAEWFMDYRNADGSVAEMCGNGVRVFARYLVDSGLAGPELAVA